MARESDGRVALGVAIAVAAVVFAAVGWYAATHGPVGRPRAPAPRPSAAVVPSAAPR